MKGKGKKVKEGKQGRIGGLASASPWVERDRAWECCESEAFAVRNRAWEE
jgi:hypothetical protein